MFHWCFIFIDGWNHVSDVSDVVYYVPSRIRKLKRESSQQKKEIQALKEKVQFIEERLDDGSAQDLARDFTWPELKNIMIKVCIQSVGHVWAYCVNVYIVCAK